jgi:hypothetical protein
MYDHVHKEKEIYTRNYYNPTGNPDRTYFESANASISTEYFLNISKSGLDGWFESNTIAVSFDILERAMKCEEHRIALLSVDTASNLYRIGKHPREKHHYDKEMLNKLREKHFLFIPISDGYRDTIKIGIQQSGHNFLQTMLGKEYKGPMPQQGQAGTHWSLLLVDCRNPAIKGRYHDSQINGFEYQD